MCLKYTQLKRIDLLKYFRQQITTIILITNFMLYNFRKCRPLWSCEDITAKSHEIRSAEQMEHFLKYVLRIFRDSMPLAHIEERWANCALQLALSCSSRHCAGRSFQVQSYLFVKRNMMLSCAFPLFTQWRIDDI